MRAGDRVLRVALATTLSLSGVKLIDFPGADGIVIAGASVALLAGLVVVVRALRAPRRCYAACRSGRGGSGQLTHGRPVSA